MAINPVGRGTKTIGINLKQSVARDLERRARSMHISKSAYCKIILLRWLESDQKLTLQEEVK